MRLTLVLALSLAVNAIGQLSHDVEIPLVSKNVCEKKESWLTNCSLKTTKVERLEKGSKLLPWRQPLRIETQGKCESQLPAILSVSLKREAKSAVEISALETKTHYLVATDKLSPGTLDLNHSTKWKRIAAFPEECESVLKITPPEPAFDRKEEVTSALERLADRYREVRTKQRWAEELSLHRATFTLILEVAEVLNERLQSNDVKLLAEKAKSHVNAIERLRKSAKLEPADGRLLDVLEDFLLKLDAQMAEKPKATVESYFSEGERKVIRKLSKLAESSDDLPKSLREINREHANFCQETLSFSEALSPWLSKEEIGEFIESLEGCDEIR